MKYSWELVDFDTKLFGFKTAKITDVEEGSVHELISNLVKNNIAYATCRFPTNDFHLVHELEGAGFILVDGLMGLSLDLGSVHFFPVDKNVREAKKADIKRLRRIAGKVFVANRFYNDPIIPKNKAPLVYEEWIENSVLGKGADAVLIFENGEILGFITLERKGHIPLVAVSKKSQGRGVAKKLINVALATFKKWGIQKINIETTIFNIPALRSYQSCGFKVVNSYLTFSWSNKKALVSNH